MQFETVKIFRSSALHDDTRGSSQLASRRLQQISLWSKPCHHPPHQLWPGADDVRAIFNEHAQPNALSPKRPRRKVTSSHRLLPGLFSHAGLHRSCGSTFHRFPGPLVGILAFRLSSFVSFLHPRSRNMSVSKGSETYKPEILHSDVPDINHNLTLK